MMYVKKGEQAPETGMLVTVSLIRPAMPDSCNLGAPWSTPAANPEV